jgi:methyl-accepting chemotaxis protein
MKLKTRVLLMSASTIFVFFGMSELLSYQPFALRFLCAIGAAATLSVAVNQLWGRLISRPINLLLDRMNSMGRGTWTQPIPVERQDEMGVLVREFNLLGPRLTYVAHQYAAASKLAALALTGHRVTRRTGIARSRLVEIQKVLSEARYQNQTVPQATLRQVGEIAAELENLSAELESEFNDELIRQGLPAQSSQLVAG